MAPVTPAFDPVEVELIRQDHTWLVWRPSRLLTH